MTRANPRLSGDVDLRWQAVLNRDKQAEGLFVYAVRTTGIYCRPTCKSRRPNPDNVLFFNSSQHAERAGFRPCKRCAPNAADPQPAHVNAIIQACRRIEQTSQPPNLQKLAQAAGLSPFHFQRLFKQTVGVTPKQYATSQRAQRLQQALRQGRPVTRAIHESGYGSSSRCYEKATDTLGMTPSQYRKGGKGMRITAAVRPCSLGWVLVAATERGICAIALGDSESQLRDQLRKRFCAAEIVEEDAPLRTTLTRVLAMLESPKHQLDLPLDIQGTAFQQRVWAALRTVKPGSTATYTEIAAKIGQPSAVRAVAGACAANRIALAIPCHRIVRRTGQLGGYRWGLKRKQAMLERETKP